jgi:hypothetical protein
MDALNIVAVPGLSTPELYIEANRIAWGPTSAAFKKRRQESNISKSDEYDAHAKKVFQYDRN